MKKMGSGDIAAAALIVFFLLAMIGGGLYCCYKTVSVLEFLAPG